MKNECYLKIFRSHQFLETKKVDLWPAVIGRGGESTVIIESENIAFEHVRVELRPEGIAFFSLVEDDGAPLLNGQKCKRSFLRVGDVLTIDSFDIAFYLTEPAKTVVPPLFGTKEIFVQSIPSLPTETIDLASQMDVNSKKEEFEEKIRESIMSKRAVSSQEKQEEKGELPASIPVEEERTQVDVPKSSQLKKSSHQKRGVQPKSIPREVTPVNKFIASGAIEVSVRMRDVTLETFQFGPNQKEITVGSLGCDIDYPIFQNTKAKYRLLSVGSQTKVYLNDPLRCEVTRDGASQSFEELSRSRRLISDGNGTFLMLSAGEHVVVQTPDSDLNILIRYAQPAPVPRSAAVFDSTPAELIAVLMSVLVSCLLAAYVSVNAPRPASQDLIEMAQPIRYAQLVYKPAPPEPEAPPVVVEQPKPTESVKTPIPKKSEPIKKPVAKKTQVKSKTQSKQKVVVKKVRKRGPVRKKSTASQRVRPKNIPKAPKKVTSFREGGSKKLGEKAGGSAATKKIDLSKVGILGVLGRGGIRSDMDEASTGVGVLQGISMETTGGVGEGADVLGKHLGTKLKDDGAGSTGFATTGIDDVGTKGLGAGDQDYGQGGIGERARPEIKFGGDEEDFVGKIDPEAIRRVIESHRNQLENCFVRELNRDLGLTSGKVVIEWKLGLGGRALATRVKSATQGFDSVGDCVVSRLESWRFPEPPPGVDGEITYPFNFVKR